MSGDEEPTRYKTRLDALAAIQRRLTVAGVPSRMLRHVPQPAPTGPGDRWMPVLEVGGRWVKVLWWDGEPRYSYPYLSSRSQPLTDQGVDVTASRVVLDYLDAKARGDVDQRGM